MRLARMEAWNGTPTPLPGGTVAGCGSVHWLSATSSAPRRVGPADDRTTADDALRRIRVRGGPPLRGGLPQRPAAAGRAGAQAHPPPSRGAPPAEAFRRERHRRREAHLLLNRLLVPVAAGWRIPLPRAPDVAEALTAALGPAPEGDGMLPLRGDPGRGGGPRVEEGRRARARRSARGSTRTTASSRRCGASTPTWSGGAGRARPRGEAGLRRGHRDRRPGLPGGAARRPGRRDRQ